MQADHSGYISLDEFCALLAAYDDRIGEEDVRAAFVSEAPNGWMSFGTFCGWVVRSFGDLSYEAFNEGVRGLITASGLSATVQRLESKWWGFKVKVATLCAQSSHTGT